MLVRVSVSLSYLFLSVQTRYCVRPSCAASLALSSLIVSLNPIDKGLLIVPTHVTQQEFGLEFPWDAPPAPGATMEVSRGIHWIRMPLPFALDHINLWVLDDGDGVTLVDSGFASSVTEDLWQKLFKSVFSGKLPRKLVCTHHHPDHMGLSGWLMQTYGIPLWTTQKEWDAFHIWSRMDQAELLKTMQDFYRRGGVPDERQHSDLERRQSMSSRKRLEPTRFDKISCGDDILMGGQSWQVIIGTGHAPELAALYASRDGILISGDQVLPKISPNVSVMPFAFDANPLKDFLESLSRFRELPADTLVLPSHKLPFYGLHDRIYTLIAHHSDRLDDALAACREPVTAAHATKVLFPRALNDHQYFFALGETLAHLNYLWLEGQVLRSEQESGTFLFERV